jgi:hypothetical protein
MQQPPPSATSSGGAAASVRRRGRERSLGGRAAVTAAIGASSPMTRHGGPQRIASRRPSTSGTGHGFRRCQPHAVTPPWTPSRRARWQQGVAVGIAQSASEPEEHRRWRRRALIRRRLVQQRAIELPSAGGAEQSGSVVGLAREQLDDVLHREQLVGRAPGQRQGAIIPSDVFNVADPRAREARLGYGLEPEERASGFA